MKYLYETSKSDNSINSKVASKLKLAKEDKLVAISLGTEHSSALSSRGRVFTWGYNFDGELGDGTTTNKSLPNEITSNFFLEVDDKIVAISLDDYYSSALSLSGRVFTWGRNVRGAIGNGTKTSKLIPTEITSNFKLDVGDKIIAISLGYRHASCLSLKGRVFTWGSNDKGALGDGTSTDKTLPTEITSEFNLSAEEKIVAISLDYERSSALTSNGRVFTWGFNFKGVLGDGTGNDKSVPSEITSKFNLSVDDKIVAITLGQEHSSALSSKGRVFTWGDNFCGELGDGTSDSKLIPTEITSKFNLAAKDKIINISTLGYARSSALSLKGRIFAWGSNDKGALGDGTSTDKTLPTEITSEFNLSHEDKIISISLGFENSSCLSSKGRVFTWGSNSSGELGDGTTTDKTLPIEITSQFRLT